MPGDSLARRRIPFGVLDRHDLDLGIDGDGFLDARQTARPEPLGQGASDERHLAALTPGFLERFHDLAPDDAAHLVLILPNEGLVERLRALLGGIVGDDDGNARLLGPREGGDDGLFRNCLHDDQIELSRHAIVELPCLQGSVDASCLHSDLHAK